MKHQEELATKSITKLLIQYSVPAITGMLVNALYNIVDRVFIGNIPQEGSLAITGIGITMPISTIILACGMLVGVGSTANISIKLGEGRREVAERIIGNNITLSVIIGLFITAIGLGFKEPILRAFGASEQTLPYANQYITIILMGTIFSVLGYSLNSNIRADGNPMIAALTMIVGCAINIILDPILIFKFGWGIKGAAIATVISQFVTAIWVLLYFVLKKSNLKFKPSDLKLDAALVRMILAIGSAPFAMQLATSLVQVIANNALKTYGGDLAIGAMATISSISLIFLMPIFGLNQGSQPIIGYNYGAKQYSRVKETFLISLGFGTFILAIGFIVVQFFPATIISFFNSDPELMEITIRGIRIYLFMLIFVSVSIVGSNFFQSIGKARLAIVLSLLRQLILLVPLILILPRLMGLDGVWLAQPISDTLAIIITLICLIRQFKHLHQKELDELNFKN